MATFTSGSRRGWGCDSSALLDYLIVVVFIVDAPAGSSGCSTLPLWHNRCRSKRGRPFHYLRSTPINDGRFHEAFPYIGEGDRCVRWRSDLFQRYLYPELVGHSR
jgi:hypothetical protein